MAQKTPKDEQSEAAETADAAEAAGGDPSAEQAAEEAIEQAQEAVDTIKAATTDEGVADGPMPLPDFGADGPAEGHDSAALALLRDVNLHVKVELDLTLMYVEDVLRLNENSIIELDKLAGDPVDVYVNERHVARGEVLVVNDNFCVRVSEIIQPIGDD
ncbi:MAG: flagellar motor switch protein FliN [Planctomycetota bacterium]|jgi:flagellar motor switch protein FliN/FliY